MTSSYKEKVYARLKEAIIAHEVKPGDIVNERVLADELHVSRTPVREAIQMLEAEGWVAVQPWKGAVVLPVTREDMEEVLQLRIMIEPMIIEMIITRLDPAAISRLESLLSRQDRLSGPAGSTEFIAIDHEFHLYLAELAGGKRLLQIMTLLRDIQLRLGVSAVQSQERFAETLHEHREIIDALRRRDCFAAKQAMLNHLIQTRRALTRQENKGDAQ